MRPSLYSIVAASVIVYAVTTFIVSHRLVQVSEKSINASEYHAKDAEPKPKHSKRTVAHAVSLITCQKASRVAGFRDALVVLRHAVHKTHRGDFGYQMVAIVNGDDANCVQQKELLHQLGYVTLFRSIPVQLDEIRNEWYRDHVVNENCCGHFEFIKLYAYTLEEYPVVVHWDIDALPLQNMDVLYHVLLDGGRLDKHHLQRPQPVKSSVMFTKDITSAQPWERVQAVQGGFVVAKPNRKHFEEMLEIVREGNYVPGRGHGSGWAGKVGLMAVYPSVDSQIRRAMGAFRVPWHIRDYCRTSTQRSTKKRLSWMFVAGIR